MYKCTRCDKRARYSSDIKCARCDAHINQRESYRSDRITEHQEFASPSAAPDYNHSAGFNDSSPSYSGGGGSYGGGGASDSWSSSGSDSSSSSSDSGSSSSGE